MSDLLQPLISLLQAYPFLFIFIGMLVAGEVVLLPAIFLATTGQLELAPVISLAVLATVLSDLAWYSLGRAFPAAALGRIPGRHSDRVVRGLERMFRQRGPQVLLASKFVYGTRTLTQILAGVHLMPFRTYFLFNFLGVVALSGALVAIAYSVVESSARLGELVYHLEITFLLFIATAVSAHLLASKVLRNKWSRA